MLCECLCVCLSVILHIQTLQLLTFMRQSSVYTRSAAVVVFYRNSGLHSIDIAPRGSVPMSSGPYSGCNLRTPFKSLNIQASCGLICEQMPSLYKVQGQCVPRIVKKTMLSGKSLIISHVMCLP